MTVNVGLTPHLERFVFEKVASGRYGSASEVVREGLMLLQRRERNLEAHVYELKRAVAVGIAAAEAGDLHDVDEVFAEIEAMHAERVAAIAR